MPTPSARPSIDRLWLILLAGGVSSAGVGSAMGQHTYTGAAGDNLWCTPGNWDPPSVPSGAAVIGPEITQRVRFASNCTPTFSTLTAQGPVLFDGVVRNSGDILASDIIIQSGSFEVGPATLGSARLSINGVGQWRTGIIARQTVRVEGGATLTVEPPASRTLRTAAMTNFGSVTQRATILLDGLSPIENRGTWIMASPNVSVSRLVAGNPSDLLNTGRISSELPAGQSGGPIFNLPIINEGEIIATSGDLNLQLLTSTNGMLTAATGYRISLNDDADFSGISICSGNGVVTSTSGLVRVRSGALANSLGAAGQSAGFVLNANPGLEIAAGATVLNGGTFTWLRGTIAALSAAGSPDGSFSNDGTFIAQAASGTLRNLRLISLSEGRLIVDPTTQILLLDSSLRAITRATIECRSGAIVRSPQSTPGVPTTISLTRATLLKTAPTPARIGCQVVSVDGDVRVEDGDLVLDRGEEAHVFQGTLFVTEAGAEFSIVSPANLTDPSITGGGAMVVRSGGVVRFDDDEAVNSMNGPGDGLVVERGKITGFGKLRNDGKLTFNSAEIGDSDVFDPPLRVENNALISFRGTTTRLAAEISNSGAATIDIDTSITMAGGSSLLNSGNVSIGENVQISRLAGSPPPVIVNRWFVTKREAGGAFISAPLENSGGTVVIQQGSLSIAGPVAELVPNGAPFPAGTFTLTGGGYDIAPTGILSFGGRIVNILGGTARVGALGRCDDFVPILLRDGASLELGRATAGSGEFIAEDDASLHLVPGGALNTAPGGSPAATFRDRSRLSGNGVVDRDLTLEQDATIAPGFSPGELTLRSLTMQSGVLSIELAGFTPVTQHDRLSVTHHATLGGTLEVTLLDGFSPPAGSVFAILNASSISGQFLRVVQPAGLAEGLRIRPVLTGSSVVLRVTFDADFNGDDFVDFFDYLDFVACFEGDSCPSTASADFNEDGFVDFFDYLDFVTAFEGGG